MTDTGSEHGSDPSTDGEAHAFLREGPGAGKGLPPRYDDGVRWLLKGYERHQGASRIALLVGWTGVWIGLWGAVFGALLGPLLVTGVLHSISPIQQYVHLGGGGAVNAFSVAAGVVVGAVGGFLVFAHFLVLSHPIQGIVSISSGFIIATLIVVLTAAYERSVLRFRGYRRLSRDEVRRVAPLVQDAADRMELTALPRFAMADLLVPNAWTHMRTVVFTTGLLDSLDDDELTAVVAHELHHWEQGDAVGIKFVWAAAWPVAMLYNIGAYLSGQTGTSGQSKRRIVVPLLTLIGYGIAWPAWIIINFILVPVMSRSQRRYEYEADAAALDAGLGPAMISALTQLSAFESGRTGWEQAISATHPPMKLRIEALQAPQPDDDDFQEEELRRPAWAEVLRLFNPWHRTPGEKERTRDARRTTRPSTSNTPAAPAPRPPTTTASDGHERARTTADIRQETPRPQTPPPSASPSPTAPNGHGADGRTPPDATAPPVAGPPQLRRPPPQEP